MDPFLFNIVLLAPLILGILLSQVLKMPLKRLTGVYLFLVIANSLIWYFLMGGVWWTPLIIGAIGFVATVIAIGFINNRVGPSDYTLMMAGVGLFPWTLWGVLAGVAYGIVLIIFAVLIALRPKFKNPFTRRYK